MPGRPQRSRTDRLYPPRRLSPRLEEAAAIVRDRPGITIAELADELGVGMNRVWQVVGQLERRSRIERKRSVS